MTQTASRTRFDLAPPEYVNQEENELSNRRAMAAVADLVEQAVVVAEGFLQHTQHRLVPLVEEEGRLPQAVDTFNSAYIWTKPSTWTEGAMMTRCNQRMTSEEVKNLLSRPEVNVGALAVTLTSLSGPQQLPRRTYLLTKESLHTMDVHDVANAPHKLSDIIAALYEMRHVDPMAQFREEKEALDHDLLAFEQQVEEQRAAHEAAMVSGKVAEVELAQRRLVASRYELLEYYAKLLAAINRSSGADAEESDTFAAQVAMLHNDAEKAASDFAEDKQQLRQAVEQDITSCIAAEEEEGATNTAAEAAFQETTRLVKKQIHDNLSRQKVLVDEILARARELLQVNEQRQELVESFVRAKTDEERRKAAYEDFLSYEQQHRSRLADCLAYLSECDDMGREVRGYVDDMLTQMPQNNIAEVVKDVLGEEAEKMYEVYRQFVLCCGDLTTRKAHRLDTLERQARLAKLNRDTALESLDPNIDFYKEELDAVVQQMKEVEGLLNALTATQDAGEKLFTIAEPTLTRKFVEQNKTFTHPLRELGLKSVEDRTRFVDRSMRYVEDEERQVHMKKSVIKQLKAAVEQDTASLQAAASLHGTNPAALM